MNNDEIIVQIIIVPKRKIVFSLVNTKMECSGTSKEFLVRIKSNLFLESRVTRNFDPFYDFIIKGNIESQRWTLERQESMSLKVIHE